MYGLNLVHSQTDATFNNTLKNQETIIGFSVYNTAERVIKHQKDLSRNRNVTASEDPGEGKLIVDNSIPLANALQQLPANVFLHNVQSKSGETVLFSYSAVVRNQKPLETGNEVAVML